MLQYWRRYSLKFCVIPPYLHNRWRHQWLNLHNRKTWISLEQRKISRKEKRHFTLLWKAFYMNVFLEWLTFQVICTSREQFPFAGGSAIQRWVPQLPNKLLVLAGRNTFESLSIPWVEVVISCCLIADSLVGSQSCLQSSSSTNCISKRYPKKHRVKIFKIF